MVDCSPPLPRRRSRPTIPAVTRRCLPRPDQRHRRADRTGRRCARADPASRPARAGRSRTSPASATGAAIPRARILREAGYTGELRAAGDVLVDQIRHMRRCGFDSFAPDKPLDPADARGRARPLAAGLSGRRRRRARRSGNCAMATEARVSARPRDRIDTAPRFTEGDAIRLNRMFRGSDTQEMLAGLFEDDLAGDVAVVSSFGAESAVLLHLVAQVDPIVPVLFLETGKHFPETLAYRDELVDTPWADQSADPHAQTCRSARREGRDRAALVLGPRWLLRDPQGQAAGPGACRIRRLDHRAQGVPGEHARAACRASRSTIRTRRGG